MRRAREPSAVRSWWLGWAWMALLGACDDHVPRQEPDELAPTEACPLGAAETVEEAEARTAELLQCLGHDPEQVAIECDVTTDWFYFERMTTEETGWTVGADTLGCHVRLGERERAYPYRVDARRIPPGYWYTGSVQGPADPLDVEDPDAQLCRDQIPRFLSTDDLEEATRRQWQWLTCGHHQEDDFSLYCWGPIDDASEYPVDIVFLCRADSHVFHESYLGIMFVGPGPPRPALP